MKLSLPKFLNLHPFSVIKANSYSSVAPQRGLS